MLFLHGAGGYADDRVLADALGESLGVAVTMPRLPDEDMSFDAWAAIVRAELAVCGPDDRVVAHSFGGSVLVRVLAEQAWPVRRAALLAVPDWTPAGWAVPDYAYDGAAPATAITLHHCRDDAVVPFFHLWLWRERFPAATAHEYPRGGHQFEGMVERLAARL